MTDNQNQTDNLNNDGISLTDSGLTAAERLAQEPDHQGRPLRLYLEGKGCDGFYYGVTFDEDRAGDREFLQGSIRLVCDSDAFTFVKGSVIDWVDDDRGRGFLVDNPRHRRFRGKFYKKKVWQERLETKREEAVAASSVTSSSQ